MNNNLFQFLLRLGDDNLIIGHRLSEWCGHGPYLEEDIALTNIALDHIGQASAWLKLAGSIEGQKRNEDDLAYHRTEREFVNLQLVEQPNTDFAYTIIRQLFFDVYQLYLYDELTKSRNEDVAALSAKSLKEIKYHVRHAREWTLRLGGGTEESSRRTQNAVNDLWRFTHEMFVNDDLIDMLIKEKTAADFAAIKTHWEKMISQIFNEAKLTIPENEPPIILNSRKGVHSENLGHILAEMQFLPRTYPNAKW